MSPRHSQQESKDLSLYKLPPRNIEAEESLISAILLDNRTLIEIIEILTPEHFYTPSHQKIFSAITELFKRSEPVDLITLTNLLTDQGEMESISGENYRGIAYLSWLADAAPRAVNAPYYARIVRDKASLRRLIEKANEITQRCYEEQGDVEEVINFAESAVFEISEDKINPSFYPISQIIETNIDALEERQGNKSLITGVPTGFTQLDRLTAGLQPSDLIILAARPSMGKTALALNLARNAAVEGDVPVGVFSLEMSKEQLSMRMLCAEARVDSSRLRSGFFSRDDWDALTEAAGVLSEAPIFIDDSADVSAIEIRAKSRRLKMEKNLGLVIIDYMQLMKGRSSAERRDLEISEISRSLKALAKELSIPVIALSQLNRKLEERADKRPMLSDLRESGSIEQDADVVAFIYRDEVYNKDENNPNRGKAEVILGKQRNGPIGTAHLSFLNMYTRFENPAPDDMMSDGPP
ncbi:DNA helicase [Desulfonema ishimotonii]|uniref:Replicative DNA helicase n=1 Tax=Desulfonema ishimotonii TaxID=45657 RepID=A0A401FQD6_9BACT|nr:replicative DNA helicase [Desulfonema ishimotonii]GBC59075.1 DNA helicase [Desulfonema ishimotonii]